MFLDSYMLRNHTLQTINDLKLTERKKQDQIMYKKLFVHIVVSSMNIFDRYK